MARERSKTDSQKFWGNQISDQQKRFKDGWYSRGENTVERYRNGGQGGKETSFNILWSNTEILKAATFSRTPPPNVARRHKTVNTNNDPQVNIQIAVAREASETIERVLEFYSEEKTFTKNLRKCRDDMLLPGRGAVWVQYNSEFRTIELEIMDEVLDLDVEREPTFQFEGRIVTPDRFIEIEGENIPVADEFVTESVELQYVYWQDFLTSDSRAWEDVWWVARQHGLDKDELVDRFGKEKIDSIGIDGATQTDSNDNKRDVFNVWEIWDKTKGERVWFMKDALDTLKIEPVKLNLKDFFPCPEPIMPFETNDTMMPIPEFLVYKDLAVELDVISSRLTSLTEAMKLTGLYGTMNKDAIANLQNGSDGQLIGVNMAAFTEGGTLNQQIVWMPIGEAAGVIQQLESRKAIIKNEIHEITGISDIVRGATDPNETATAQRLKGSFGSLRLRPRREPMEELIRDVYGIMGEIIAEQFDQSTIEKITGKPVHPFVMEFLQDDELRDFRIDIETDATVQPNQEIDQRNAVQFVEVINSLFTVALPAVKETPELGPLVGATMKFVGNQFKAGRELMGIFDETIDRLSQQGQQPQGEDVASQIAAQQRQIEQGKLQIEQGKLQVEQGKLQGQQRDQQLEQQQQQIDVAALQQEERLTNQNNEVDLLQDQIRGGVQVTTAQIEAATSADDNNTKLAVEQLKQLASRRLN